MRKILIVAMVCINLIAANTIKAEPKYTAEIVPKKMTVQTKKGRFYYLIAPAVDKVYQELLVQHDRIKKDIASGTNKSEIDKLKATYKVKTDEKLLQALMPHPQSIVIAQAAMESAWATSRFFVKAKNIFGMWSVNKNEPRIAAGEKRGGTKTIWLKKFSSIEQSVRSYYKMMGRGRAYKEFRALRVQTKDPHQLVKKLDKYSEIGAEYGKELSQIIRYNKLAKYDN